MRLSATERIIREAEEQDASGASSATRDSGRVVEALPAIVTARDPSRGHAWTPSFDVDIDGIGIDDDDEGETQVDAERAAAALRELRSYETPRGQPRSHATPSPSADALLQSGRIVWPSAPESPQAISPVPALSGVPEVTDPRFEPRTRFSMALTVDPPRSRHAVGRRMGILIAALTTAIVALGVGGLMTDSGHLAIGKLTRQLTGGTRVMVIPPTRAPRAPVIATIVSTTQQVPAKQPWASSSPAPKPAPIAARPAPAAVTPAAGAAAAHVPAPVAVSPTENPSTPRLAAPTLDAASTGTPRGHVSAAVKPRPSRKLTPHKSYRRKGQTHAAKVGASHPRPIQAEVANVPPTRPAAERPRIVDPDSTLPITQ